MADQQWNNLKEIFHAAVKLPSSERAAYLDEACGMDAGLRSSIESLFNSHEKSENFVDAPAYEAAAEL